MKKITPSKKLKLGKILYNIIYEIEKAKEILENTGISESEYLSTERELTPEEYIHAYLLSARGIIEAATKKL